MKIETRLDELTENLLKVIDEYYENKDKNRTHVPGKDVIQHAGPYLRKEEFLASIKTLLNEWMVVGKNGQEFEINFVK